MTSYTNLYIFSDLLNYYKKHIRTNWERSYADFAKTFNRQYFLLHPTLPTKIPHISNFDYRKQYTSIISRLRINHGRFPAHLFKIGIVNSPACSCNKALVGDLNHIFFECIENKIATTELYNLLINFYFPHRTNITALLANIEKSVLDAIVDFINKSKLPI